MKNNYKKSVPTYVLKSKNVPLASGINSLKYKKISKLHAAKTQPMFDTSSKIKIPFPTFKGFETERPVKFLIDLNTYLRVKKIAENERLSLVLQTLKDIAKDWWFVIADNTNNYNQFKSLFKERYWNSLSNEKQVGNSNLGNFIPTAKCLELIKLLQFKATPKSWTLLIAEKS